MKKGNGIADHTMSLDFFSSFSSPSSPSPSPSSSSSLFFVCCWHFPLFSKLGMLNFQSFKRRPNLEIIQNFLAPFSLFTINLSYCNERNSKTAKQRLDMQGRL